MRSDPVKKRKSLTAQKLVLLAGFALLVGAATPAAAEEELSEEAKAQANNPLAAMSAFNLQNFYSPSLWNVPELSTNTFYFRAAFPLGRTLTRASLPLSSRPTSLTTSEAGLGDFNIFTAYLFVSNPTTSIGLGPLLVAPTATDSVLGQDSWQLGAAFVVFKVLSPVVQAGGLVTWQTDIAGDDDRADVSFVTAQPFAVWQVGGGKYLRSTAIWTFDLGSGHYAMPLGLGVGQVVKSGRIVYNMFLEPQWTVLHKGAQAKWTIFLGIHFQFAPLLHK